MPAGIIDPEDEDGSEEPGSEEPEETPASPNAFTDTGLSGYTEEFDPESEAPTSPTSTNVSSLRSTLDSNAHVHFEQGDNEQVPKPNRGFKRQGTNFASLGDVPAEEDDEEDSEEAAAPALSPESRQISFHAPEGEGQGRRVDRVPTGFVPVGELPEEEDDEDEDDAAEGRVRFDEEEEGLEKIKRSPKRADTGCVRPDQLRDEDEEDENEGQVRFQGQDDGDPKAGRRVNRVVTGFVKPGDLPEEDEDDGEAGNVRFTEPEDHVPNANRSPKRVATGFVKGRQLPDEEEEEEGSVRFAEPEGGFPVVTRSVSRVATGYVKPGALPEEEDDEDEQADPARDPPENSRQTSQEVQNGSTPTSSRSSRKSASVSFDTADGPADRKLLSRKSSEIRLGTPRDGSGSSSRSGGMPSPGGRSQGSLEVGDPRLVIEDSVRPPASGASHGSNRSRDAPSVSRGSPSERALQKSRSTPSPFGRKKLPPMKRGPLAGKLNLRTAELDAYGTPKVNIRRPKHTSDWDENHHKTGTENELLPKKLRNYFSKHAQSLPDLKEELRGLRHGPSISKQLDRPEIPWTKPSPITADGGAPLVPERHTFGGAMQDRDDEVRPWNDRWQNGMSKLNAGLHPLHRAYFCQKSLFEDAKSQRWRRYLDFEIEHGVWKSIDTRKPQRFPPLGV